jgi:hypothetical protein
MRRISALILLTLLAADISVLAQAPPTQRTTPYFKFHSSFWVNLHQRLFFEASNAPPSAEVSSKNSPWDLALKFYKDHYSGNSLLFDSQLIQINDWLATQPDDGSTLNISGLPADVGKVLQSAAESYRLQWASVNSNDERWIKEMEPKATMLAPEVVPQLEAELGMPWPQELIRIDVSEYVREIGEAYTTDHPPHTTISSRSQENQDTAGLEIIFHEASHTMSRKIEKSLSSECAIKKKNCGDLWHAVLFYTVGNAVKRSLPADQKSDYVPYAYSFGLYNHGMWKAYRIALEKDWQPYLDGKVEFEDAIRALVRNL